jgi:hypothetical protein
MSNADPSRWVNTALDAPPGRALPAAVRLCDSKVALSSLFDQTAAFPDTEILPHRPKPGTTDRNVKKAQKRKLAKRGNKAPIR